MRMVHEDGAWCMRVGLVHKACDLREGGRVWSGPCWPIVVHLDFWCTWIFGAPGCLVHQVFLVHQVSSL